MYSSVVNVRRDSVNRTGMGWVWTVVPTLIVTLAMAQHLTTKTSPLSFIKYLVLILGMQFEPKHENQTFPIDFKPEKNIYSKSKPNNFLIEFWRKISEISDALR